MTEETLPDVVQTFAEKYPAVWDAYKKIGEAVAASGPLDEKTERLVKLGIAIGAAKQGAVRSHTRRALKQGISPEALRQTAMLAITTAGWPAAFAAYCWIDELLNEKSD